MVLSMRPMIAVMLSLAAFAGCTDRPARPSFLCCVSTCTGGLVKASKHEPAMGDAGFYCADGLPIEYNGTCAVDDGADCEDNSQQGSSGGAGGSDAGRRADAH